MEEKGMTKIIFVYYTIIDYMCDILLPHSWKVSISMLITMETPTTTKTKTK